MRGLIMIDRAILDHHIVGMKNPARLAAWLWFLSEAQYKPRMAFYNGAEILIERGQLLAPIRDTAARVNMSVKQYRNFLSILTRSGMVSKRGTPKGTLNGTGATVLTICNYDIYQDYEKYRAIVWAHQRAEKGHSRGTAGAHALTPEVTPEVTPEEDLLSFALQTDEPDPVQIAIDLFKKAAEKSDWPIPRILTKARRSAMAARLTECGGIEGWKSALEKAQASAHCNGGNDRGWVLDFDFITRQSSFAKLMEGNYDNRDSKTNGTGTGNGRGMGQGATPAEIADRGARWAASRATGS